MPLVRVELARVELALGRRAAALRQTERALACRREGGFAEGLRLAAELCEQLGRVADARRYLEQLARLAPGDAEIAARAAALAAAPDGPRRAPPPDPALPPALAALADAAVEAPCLRSSESRFSAATKRANRPRIASTRRFPSPVATICPTAWRSARASVMSGSEKLCR